MGIHTGRALMAAVAVLAPLYDAGAGASASDTLRLRMQIVESCTDPAPARTAPTDSRVQCSAPHQRGELARFPAQLQRLAPPQRPDEPGERGADTVVF